MDSLPGVPGGSSFVGSFDREEAVEDETIDFFASGHPLVEGIFAHVEDSPLGRVVRLVLETGSERGCGLVAIYKDGLGFDVVAFDSIGRRRPDWAAAFRQRPLRARRMPDGAIDDRQWTEMIRRLGCAPRTGAQAVCAGRHRGAASPRGYRTLTSPRQIVWSTVCTPSQLFENHS